MSENNNRTEFDLCVNFDRALDQSKSKPCCVEVNEAGTLWVHVDGACFRTTLAQLNEMCASARKVLELKHRLELLSNGPSGL